MLRFARSLWKSTVYYDFGRSRGNSRASEAQEATRCAVDFHAPQMHRSIHPRGGEREVPRASWASGGGRKERAHFLDPGVRNSVT